MLAGKVLVGQTSTQLNFLKRYKSYGCAIAKVERVTVPLNKSK